MARRGIGVARDGLMGGEVGGPPPASAIKTSIGNTAAEALAAMLADNNGNDEESRLLEAVLLDAMQDLDQPDGAARIDARLHAKGFGSLPGGSETKTIPQTQSVTAQPHIPDPNQTDPGVFSSLQPPKPGVVNALGGKEQVLGVSIHPAASPLAKLPPTMLKGGMESVIGWAATRNSVAQHRM